MLSPGTVSEHLTAGSLPHTLAQLRVRNVAAELGPHGYVEPN